MIVTLAEYICGAPASATLIVPSVDLINIWSVVEPLAAVVGVLTILRFSTYV